MDQTGIDRAVVMAGRNTDNSALLAAAQHWPGRLLPFLTMSPEFREFRPAWEADDARFEPWLDSVLTAGGFLGIGEISVTHFPGTGFPEAAFDPDGRTMQSILRQARKHQLPVLVHVEITRLRELEGLLRRFPDVVVIWAHGGYTPLFLARRLLDAHPNLVYELSARTWSRHPRSPDYTIFRNATTVWEEWIGLVEAIPTRFLVGTDASSRSAVADRERIESVHRFLAQLSPPTRALVATGNLTRLLRLQPGAH